VTDLIRLTGLEVFAYHGVLPEEQEHGQVFIIDVEVGLDLSVAADTDELTSTLHYGELAQSIHDRVAGERWDLIERVAARVADLVMQDDRVEHVKATIHKPSAPIPLAFADVSVTVERSR